MTSHIALTWFVWVVANEYTIDHHLLKFNLQIYSSEDFIPTIKSIFSPKVQIVLFLSDISPQLAATESRKWDILKNEIGESKTDKLNEWLEPNI